MNSTVIKYQRQQTREGGLSVSREVPTACPIRLQGRGTPWDQSRNWNQQTSQLNSGNDQIKARLLKGLLCSSECSLSKTHQPFALVFHCITAHPALCISLPASQNSPSAQKPTQKTKSKDTQLATLCTFYFHLSFLPHLFNSCTQNYSSGGQGMFFILCTYSLILFLVCC